MSSIKITELNNVSLTEVKESEMTSVVGGALLDLSNLVTIENVGNVQLNINTGVITQTLTNFTNAVLEQSGFNFN